MSGWRVRQNRTSSASASADGWGGLKPAFTDGAALQLHLGSHVPTPVGDGKRAYISSFWAAVRDARQATKRDMGTGAVTDEPSTGSWIGAIGYMALLDQIGSSLKPAGVRPAAGAAIVCALTYWTTLDAASIDALYALRCALAHDYSLFNKNARNPSLQHLFALDRRATGDVVRLPARPWGGDYEHRDDDMRTWVSLRLLGDLAEEVVAAVVAAHAAKNIEIILPGGANELAARYSIVVPWSTGP
jgi:hypothetical protein